MQLPFKNELKRQLYTAALGSKQFKASESLMIFGDPRGGTTWLMELLGSLPNTILVEEPLHVRDGCFRKELNFGWRQPIPKGSKWPEATRAFGAVLSGKEISASALRPNTFLRILGGNRLLLKFVRGNALLSWLCDQFEFRYAPIYLLRHPLAVASSQIQNFPESSNFRPFEVPSHPYNDIYRKHISFLRSLSTRLEQLVALWCLHNQESIQQKNVRWIKIYYEDLLLQPIETLEQLSRQWGIEFSSALFRRVSRRSSSDYSYDLRSNPNEQLEKWHRFHSRRDIQKLQAILDYFDIQAYRADKLLPCAINKP